MGDARRDALCRQLAPLLACACVLAACSAASKPGPRTTVLAGGAGATAAATTSTTGPTRYTVAAGDTLTAIARRFGVSVSEVAAANHLANLNQLTPGQVLTIPAAKPVRLVISPAQSTAGNVFAFNLFGAKPDEVVLFEILRPDGTKFVGPAHVAQPDGTVSTDYLTSVGDQPGVYKVLAGGNEGTVAHTQFQLVAAPASTTS